MNVSSENTNLIKILKNLDKYEIQRSFLVWISMIDIANWLV
jgi:hypothetical protein